MNKRVLFSNNGSIEDFSTAMEEYKNGSKVLPFVAAEDFIYIGSRLPFNHIYFKLKVPNLIASTMTAKYWDGSAWVDFVDTIEETNGFTESGFVTFVPNRDKPWKMSSTNYSSESVDGLESVTIYDMYWVRLEFSADLSSTTELQFVGSLFCNDDDLAGEYPDFARNNVKAAYEAGKTSWEEQAVIASKILIDDLIKKGVIDDGNQILNRSDYTLSCVHKLAEIICNAFGDDYADQKKAAREEYNQRLSKRIHKVDVNKSGREEPFERVHSTGWFGR
jgi:hypothetical protein